MNTGTIPGTTNIMDILEPHRPVPEPSPAQVIAGWVWEELEIRYRRFEMYYTVK